MKNETFKMVAKLYGRTVFSSVLCFFVYVSIMMMLAMTAKEGEAVSDGWLLAGNIVSLVLQTCIFVALIYSDVWLQGDRDRNAVNFGRMTADKWRGLKVGLLASIPAIVSFVLLVAEKLVGFWGAYATLYRLLHITFYPIMVWSMGVNVAATAAGVSWGGILAAGIPVLVLPVVTTVAYLLGYAQIALGERMVYKKK